jgi:hypothetical protein
MVKWKRTKGQTMIHKALHRKLMIEQHESHCEYEKRNISVAICDTGLRNVLGTYPWSYVKQFSVTWLEHIRGHMWHSFP